MNEMVGGFEGELAALEGLTQEQRAALAQINAALGAAAVIGHARFLSGLGVNPDTISVVSAKLARRLDADALRGDNSLALGLISFTNQLGTPVPALAHDQPLGADVIEQAPAFDRPTGRPVSEQNGRRLDKKAARLLANHFRLESAKDFEEMDLSMAADFVDLMIWYFAANGVIPRKEMETRLEEYRLHIIENLSWAEISNRTHRHADVIINHFSYTQQKFNRLLKPVQQQELYRILIKKLQDDPSFIKTVNKLSTNALEFIEQNRLPLPASNAADTINQYFDITDHPATYRLRLAQRRQLAEVLSDIFIELGINHKGVGGKRSDEANSRMRQLLYLRLVGNMDWKDISAELGMSSGRAAVTFSQTRDRFRDLFSIKRRREIFMLITSNPSATYRHINHLLEPDNDPDSQTV